MNWVGKHCGGGGGCIGGGGGISINDKKIEYSKLNNGSDVQLMVDCSALRKISLFNT